MYRDRLRADCHHQDRRLARLLAPAGLLLALATSNVVTVDSWAQQTGGTQTAPAPAGATGGATTDPVVDPTIAGQLGIQQTTPGQIDQSNPKAYQDVIVDGEKHSWRPLETGTQQAWEAYRNGEYQAAVPVFARLAKLGHPVAEWLMGNLYFAGQGVPQDYRQALIWFEKAADQGYMPAYAPTAKLYEQGKGTPIDLGKAYLWYNIAIAALPYSIERYSLEKQRDSVGLLMTQAQIEAAQKRSLGFQPRKVIPPDIEQARKILGE
jgi:TPR repeat protein